MLKALKNFNKRKFRTRQSIKIKAYGKPRLSVYRSNKHISVQLIDDSKGITIASASTYGENHKSVNIDVSTEIGKLIAQKALERNITEIVFDRGGHIYHGNIKAIAESARKNGLKF